MNGSSRPTRDRRGATSWWVTVPGILTGTAAVITAISSLVITLKSCGSSPHQPGAAPVLTSSVVVSPKDGAPVNCSHPSRPSSRATTIDFVNESSQAVQVLWIDFAGREEAFGRLDPGGDLEESTFVNHSWCIRDVHTRRALALAVATESPQRISLR